MDYRVNYATGLLNELARVPELRTGVEDKNILLKHKELIGHLLADLFPTVLSQNEIKAIAIPFHTLLFNPTQRFQKILSDAGEGFEIKIRDFDEHQSYIMSCCMILKYYFGYDLDFAKPVFYDIPDANGNTKHYRILYNGDFLELFPTQNAPNITTEDVDELLDNYENIALWKEKFPPNSWILKGFGILTLFDSTVESAVSLLKENLLVSKKMHDAANSENLEEIFRSIYKIPGLKLGFTEYNLQETKFRKANFGKRIESYLLNETPERLCSEVLGPCSLETIIGERKYFSISDVAEFARNNPDDVQFAKALLAQGVQSCIFAPIVKDGKLLGVLELISEVPKQLNSINAQKLDFVLPYIVDTMERYYAERQNHIDAIIQKEYTAIHPSVYWKFREEAERHTFSSDSEMPFREILFKEVYPLFGQIDIKGSSDARNQAMQRDLKLQLSQLGAHLRLVLKKNPLPIIEQHLFELSKMEAQLDGILKADTESVLQNFIWNEIHPLLEHFEASDAQTRKSLESYRATLDPQMRMVYRSRRDFDETLALINKKMAAFLDKKQEEAQQFFPHYYERFKTDGVEHNLYIGASISPKVQFHPIYLDNLRLWQLQAMIEMEQEYHRLRPNLAYDLDVTSLILVSSTPIAIRFRMDEKRFDVDGTYNARYEVVKKRIDKAHVRNTSERITQSGKITIVYSQKQEETEYRRYLKLVQYKNLIQPLIEVLDIEDLQGVTGLRALRVEVVHSLKETSGYTFDELVSELSTKT